MTKQQEQMTYLVLFFVAFGLLVYLIVDAATAYRGEDINLAIIESRLPGSEEEEDPGALVENIFMQRDLLFPIITPEPTPTEFVKPTATPTPIPFAEVWKLKMILGKNVAFTDETGNMVHKAQGDEHFGVLIKEVNAAEGTMLLEYLGDGQGRTKILKQQM